MSAAMARAIMLQGTGSDVGKSLIAAGLARAFADRGLRVAPFKPQNMSNNAAVTVDGGEIGRAQALQARAARIAPSVHMNPVLLKPETTTGAQVIVQGRRHASMGARQYFAARGQFMPPVLDSFRRLARESDLVIVEGAGSPAEVNLRHGDLANMGFAHAAGVPAVLVGDIHRGGVIASLAGTFAVLAPEDAAMIRGTLVNNFHGDPSLFEDGVQIIEARTGVPCLGVVPHFAEARRLPAEDAVALETVGATGRGPVKVCVPRLSRIANFDDLDPLKLEAGITLTFVQPGEAIPGDAALVIVPGSKATIADLAFLREQGWDIDLAAHVRRGGHVLGLCGGYQMLGRAVHDPHGYEGPPGSAAGLSLLDVETTLTGDKTLTTVHGIHTPTGEPVTGYEIHLGHTAGPGTARPFAVIGGRPDGAVSASGRVAGTYLHGCFAADGFRRAFLADLGVAPGNLAFESEVEAALDGLAAHLEAAIDLTRFLSLAAQVTV
jgi:adenosylcobyric acid synthase